MSKVITVLNTLEVQLRPLSSQHNFGLPHYRLHTVFSKEIAVENLVKIALELSILEAI